jgi:hypothetical protein
MSDPFDSGTSGISVSLDVPFPSNAISGPGVKVDKTNSTWVVSLDIPDLVDGGSPATPSNIFLPGYDVGLLQNNKYRLDNIIAGATGLDSRTPRGDANYSILITDRYIGLTAALTAVRTFTLPAASTVPGGRIVTIQDEVGGISGANYLSFVPTGADTLNGASSYLLKAKYGGVSFRSNGTNAWNVITLAQRRAVADANYTALQGDSIVAYTSITAARVVTLPAASAFQIGQRLTIVDESGSCSGTNTISVTRAGADTINGSASAQVVNLAFGYLAIESDGVSKWTVVDASAVAGSQISGAINGVTIGATTPSTGAFTTLSATGTASFANTTVAGTFTQTSTSSVAVMIGPNGATNPSFRVDCAFASAANGLYVRALSAGSSLLLQTLSSATNESIVIDAKGSGAVFCGANSSGGVNLASGGGTTFVGAGGLSVTGASTLTGQATFNATPFVIPAECRLTRQDATHLKLIPYNGNMIKIAGNMYPVPSAGVSIANGTFSASTFYYIYAFQSAGVVTLENSTTTHATDTTAGNVGVEIKSGDNTRTLVGCAITDGSSNFFDTDTQRWTLSWFNRQPKRLRNNFTAARSTVSTTFVEINTEIRVNFLAWADDLPSFVATGQVSGSTTNITAAAISIDGVAPSATVNGTGPQIVPFSTHWAQAVTEGANHYATVFGGTTSGTGNFPTSSVSSGGFPELHGSIMG